MVLAQNAPDLFIGCGTTIGAEEYTFDRFFGNNQDLVDILIDHKVNIDENYLQQLDNMEVLPQTGPEMFSRSSVRHEVPIKAWVYRNDNGTGNISTSQVYQVVDVLNSVFSSHTNIIFYLLCDIGIVNNSNYTNFGDQYFSTYTANNRTPGAINVHFVNRSAPPPGLWAGIAYLPWQTTPYACAIETNGFSPPYQGDVLAHEIGHNLGLRHTHDTARSSQRYNESAGNCYQEAVSRSKRQGLFCVSTINKLKCEINGDGLCDTEADPGIRRQGRFPHSYLYPNSCTYNSSIGGQDNWSDTWTPTVANIMSYAPAPCRTFFSPLQVGKMYGYIAGIGISDPTFNISGPSALCSDQIGTYAVNPLPGVSNYFWEVPGNMTILPNMIMPGGGSSGQGTTTVRIKANNEAGGIIKVTPKCGSKTATLNILDLNDLNIDGFDQGCPLSTYTYSVPEIAGANYFWTATNGIILGSPYSRNVQVKLTESSSNQTNLHLLVTICGHTISVYKTIIHDDPPFPSPPCNSIEDMYLPGTTPEQKIPLTEFGEMLLFPNPSSTEVTIIAPTRDRFNLNIFNSMGQSLYEGSVEIQNKRTIDVNAFPDGIYYVKLEGETGIFTKKLILKK